MKTGYAVQKEAFIKGGGHKCCEIIHHRNTVYALDQTGFYIHWNYIFLDSGHIFIGPSRTSFMLHDGLGFLLGYFSFVLNFKHLLGWTRVIFMYQAAARSFSYSSNSTHLCWVLLSSRTQIEVSNVLSSTGSRRYYPVWWSAHQTSTFANTSYFCCRVLPTKEWFMYFSDGT